MRPLRVAGLLALVVVMLSVPQDVAGSHAHVGNQGQVFRLAWIDGGNYNASRGPNDCVEGYCHGPGAADFLLGDITVKAVGDGIIVRSRFDSCFGNVVEVKHAVGGGSYNYKSQYAHLAVLPPYGEGWQATQGEVMGAMDTTGSCIIGGAHLHFDICPVSDLICNSTRSVSWPAQISQTDAGMWSSPSHYARSNNAGLECGDPEESTRRILFGMLT